MSATVFVRCPRCKGSSFSIFERIECAHLFRVENGQALPMMVSQELPARIGFAARCDCGHCWTPRHKAASKVMSAEEAARAEERP